MDPATRWRATASLLDFEPPSNLLDELVSAWSEPHRAYHTLQHLAECFALLDEGLGAADDPAALELALWFRDAIYDTKRSDNERRSADWALRALGAASADRLQRIEQLILVTRHASEPTTHDEALLLDVDLSILGAAESRFEAYESQVRIEYGWVPEQAYREARGRILRGFLERPALFHGPVFVRRFEERARTNLRRSLARLESR